MSDYEFDPGRFLTKQEIEAVKDSITHISKVPKNLRTIAPDDSGNRGRRNESVNKPV